MLFAAPPNGKKHQYIFVQIHSINIAGESFFGSKYCTISTVSSRILKFWSPRWPINYLLSSSDLTRGLFFRLTELTVETVQ